jgi:hypothetical protein
MMGFYDGSADIQAHSHTIRFSTEKRLKYMLGDRFSNATPAIGYLDSEHRWEDAGVQICADFKGRGCPARGKRISLSDAVKAIFEKIH